LTVNYLCIFNSSGVRFLFDHLDKIKKARGDDMNEVFRQFLNQRLEQTELTDDYNHLFLLVFGAHKFNIYSKNLFEFIKPKSRNFSLYLYHFKHHFKNFSSSTKQLFISALEKIAIHGESKFWWLMFAHFDNLSSECSDPKRKIQPKEMSQALMETLSEIPEVLLSDDGCACRVLNFLLQHNELDTIAGRLLPTLSSNAHFLSTVENFLLTNVLSLKSNTDDLIQVLKSDFLKNIYGRTIQSESNDTILLQITENFKQIICQIYDRMFLFDTVLLACKTPQHLLSLVVPIVEKLIAQKLGLSSTLTPRDYQNFAQLDDDHLKNYFPAAKQRIDVSLLEMTDEFVKSGNMKDIPTISLLLLGLSRKKDLYLLQRPSCTDLLNAIINGQNMFFHNLHSVLNTNLNRTMKQHRKGETKNIVECLEVNNFNFLLHFI